MCVGENNWMHRWCAHASFRLAGPVQCNELCNHIVIPLAVRNHESFQSKSSLRGHRDDTTTRRQALRRRQTPLIQPSPTRCVCAESHTASLGFFTVASSWLGPLPASSLNAAAPGATFPAVATSAPSPAVAAPASSQATSPFVAASASSPGSSKAGGAAALMPQTRVVLM
jgi:hypothetical protein